MTRNRRHTLRDLLAWAREHPVFALIIAAFAIVFIAVGAASGSSGPGPSPTVATSSPAPALTGQLPPPATVSAAAAASPSATRKHRHHHHHATPAPAPPPPTPAPAGCYPTTDSGNCYEPGEFCRSSDAGMHGVAGDGEAIVCEDNNGLRWEPA